ncbi:molecular chaperone [Novosphingobium sp. ZW T3_23]|uniref:fimbrial biogenesis chaperone n=1 Tax=Novosphingobium sp. ZW T3_23 TaxID=3378084 RepID=UPI00385451C1
MATPVPDAMASALRVTPIRIEVPPGDRFCAITLANDGDLPVSVQIRGFRWSKSEKGDDVLEPAGGLVINPTIVTLGGGMSRLIRCSLPRAEGAAENAGPESAREETWRLLFDELATADGPARPGEIRTLLRISVPIFRAGQGARADLAWEPSSRADAGSIVAIVNRGNRHARVLSIELVSAAGRVTLIRQGGYVLAGGRLEFAVPGGNMASIKEVRVRTEEAVFTASRLADAGDGR